MNKQAFTLIELLVVVLIIGILASMAMPGYVRAIEKSRSAEAMNMVKNINDAVYAYAAERSECPPSFSKLLIEVPGTGNTAGTEVTGKDTSAPIPATDSARTSNNG